MLGKNLIEGMIEFEDFERDIPWDGPHSIQNRQLIVPAPEFPGVYRIAVKAGRFRKELHGPHPVICYGMSKNLTSRLAYFFSAAKGIKNSHSEGKEFHRTQSHHGLDIDDLLYWYCEIKKPDTPRRVENCLLLDFKKAFGRLPLLNHQT